MVKYDQNSLEIMNNLLYYKIPRCITVVFPYLTLKKALIVTVNLKNCLPEGVYIRSFW
jgi:hypothetical protein